MSSPTLEELREAARAGRPVYCVLGGEFPGETVRIAEIPAEDARRLDNSLAAQRGYWLVGEFMHERLSSYRLTRLAALELRVERCGLAVEAAQKALQEADRRLESATAEYEDELARERAESEGK